MENLLGNMDNITDVPPPLKQRKRKTEHEPQYSSRSTGKAPSRSNGHQYRNGRDAIYDGSSDGPTDLGFGNVTSDDDDFDVLSPNKKLKVDNEALIPTTNKLSQIHVDSSGDEMDVKAAFGDDDAFEGVDMDAFMEVDDFDESPKPKMKKEETVSELPKRPTSLLKAKEKQAIIDTSPTWLSVYDSLQVKSEDSLGPQAGSSSKASSYNASVLEEDGSLRFFWLDYLEHDGRVYFIGKTLDKISKTWLSCCVTVENLQRNLFVLPRERRMEEDEETGELVETDIVPSLPDVYNDFDRVRKKLGIKSFKGKFVKRKYAFGEDDVPRGETQWLKVVYPFEGMPSSFLIFASY